ncbi:MAG: hypothetical protein BroJett040_08270 [Oligoflexia bacterium]|nr:MAG: hypothetical protein BroJett040_08270 [Oligoflexia bacterium]
MQTAFSFFEIEKVTQRPERKVTSSPAIMLTDRDLEVISFVNEMKFASLDDLYFKFFRVLKSGGESKSQWWARERISVLIKSNYLSRVHSFNERKPYFLGTTKGYLTLTRRCPEKFNTRPLERIDQNTFEHDKLLLKTRLKLEVDQKATSWISDRQLFQFPELCLNFGEGNQPDALYTNSNGERVAFELEVARKAKKRYADKIRNYVFLMREQKDNPLSFKKVHIVALNEVVRDLILSEIKIYPQYFEIQMMSEVLSEK